MEESRNQKVFALESNLKEYISEKSILESEVVDLNSKLRTLKSKLASLEEGDDKSELLGYISVTERSIFANNKILERKDEVIKTTKEQIDALLPSRIDKTAYAAWLNLQEVKPTVSNFSNKAKSVVDDVRDNIADKFNKESVNETFDKVKGNKHVQDTTEKVKVVKEELSDLNLYKIIGQIKKNATDTAEDLNVYMKNHKIDEKIKSQVDNYFSPEVKGRVATFFSKIKASLADAAEIISDNEENETEAERREKLRKLKGVKENYLKSWVRENKVVVDNNVRSNIELIHKNYLDFMKEEYGQDSSSKLIISEYSEFVKVAAKYFNVPLIFNVDESVINLKINA